MELHNSLQMQMNELSLQNPELRPQFKTSAATYGCIAKNAEKLKFCIDTFLTDLETLLDKAITDAMESVKLYETCRLDYDIVKREFETEGRTCNSELQEKKRKLNQAEETLRVKVDLLNQNRITRLKKHLRVLNEATVAFYTGNELALNKAIESITSNVD
ncbi:arfaptin-2-like [Zophobas morio]|uniref:arfaptin-2-like n=1 Tax=Zophobas morio TaxID=2755281 RepID=UPI003082E35B